MQNLTTIILLNDLDDTYTLKKGLNIAKEDNSSVVVLYVYEKEHFSLKDLFFFEDKTLDKEAIKNDIQNKIQEYGYDKDVAILIYEEDSEDRILALIKDDKKYKVIIAYHKDISKRVVSKVDEEILIVKNELLEYEKIALLVDSPKYDCIKYYKDKKPTLLYDAYIEYDPAIVDPAVVPDIDLSSNLIDIEKKNFEEIKSKNGLDGEFFVNGAGLIDYIKDNDFDLSVVCKEIKDIFGLDSIFEEYMDTTKGDILILEGKK